MLHTLGFIIGILFVVILVGSIAFLAIRYYQNRNIKDTHTLEKIIEKAGAKYIDKDGSVGLVIGVVKDDKIFIKGFGKESKNGDKIPDGKTLFELASIGKTFTASAAQIFVDRGEISWDDKIDKYLSGKVEICEQIKDVTLRHLATHTLGLASFPKSFFPKIKDELNPYKHLTTQGLYDYLGSCEENTEIGKYAYSNLGMGLLGHILELQTKKTYEAIIKEEIVEKLGMENTTITLNEDQTNILAQGYNENGKPNPVWEDRVLTGAGSFISNAEDVCKFIKANFDAKRSEISESLVKTHEKLFNGKTGLGWHHNSRFWNFITGEEGVIWHNGASGGYRSFIAVNKNAKSGVIILSNSTNDVTVLGTKLNFYASKISFADN